MAGREIAMVFQDPMTSLHPMLTVGSQLTDHMRFHLRLGKAAAESRAAELLDEVRIPDPKRALRAYPHQFSGGMRQRIAIAVALACGPKLLIADEPTSALDVTVQAGILRLLDRLRREHGLSVILVTHDLGVMSAIANRLSILYAGRVVECGSRTAVLQHPRHPYTRALLDALPQAEPGREPLAAIGGTSPRPDDLPSGCRLSPAMRPRPHFVRRRDPTAEGRGRARVGLSRRPLRRRMNVLELRDIVVDYERRGGGSVRAVAGASLAVGRGRIVGLVGESGCGKSSLARAAVGLIRPAGGTVVFDGREVPPLGRGARPRELTRLQLVFQNPSASLNPRRRVGTQLIDGLDAPGAAPGIDKAVRARELCDLVGLPSTAVARFPHEFSGGERQRIAIARALAADPSVIVLDEPFASLDASTQAQLANLIVELSRELDLGILLISHDLAIARHVADEVAVMYLGLIVEAGSTQQVWNLPLHPYTEALIRAIPHPDGAGVMPEALAGEVPDPTRRPPGCAFHPRCPHAFERCLEESPPLVTFTGGRAAACWLQPAGATPLPLAERV